jgi:hypothetical protein
MTPEIIQYSGFTWFHTKKTHIRDVSIMTYKTTYKYDMAMTQYFLMPLISSVVSSPTPEGLDDPYPFRTSRFEVMICIQWVYSPFFTIIIHYCSPLLFTTIVRHHYSPLYIHHYIYIPLNIYIYIFTIICCSPFSTALALQGYPRSPNAQPFRTRELGAKNAEAN